MALITEAEVRATAQKRALARNRTAKSVLQEEVTARASESKFDIFMSHSRLDAEIVLGAKTLLEQGGRRVYVDWIDDAELDRTKVTPATADKLRTRMKQSLSMFYLHSEGSSSSRWMPWELGYFDALNGNVAIFPIVKSGGQQTFKGEEYLGLYPYVELSSLAAYASPDLLIRRSTTTSSPFRTWLVSPDKLRPT